MSKVIFIRLKYLFKLSWFRYLDKTVHDRCRSQIILINDIARYLQENEVREHFNHQVLSGNYKTYLVYENSLSELFDKLYSFKEYLSLSNSSYARDYLSTNVLSCEINNIGNWLCLNFDRYVPADQRYTNLIHTLNTIITILLNQEEKSSREAELFCDLVDRLLMVFYEVLKN